MARTGTRIALLFACLLIGGACVAAVFAEPISSFLLNRILLRESPGRLTIPASPQTMIAGEPNPIPLELHGHKPRSGDVRVSYFVRDDAGFVFDSLVPTPVLWRSDGSPYVNITPEKTGNARFDIEVTFIDGRYDTATTAAAVQLPTTKPISFRIHTPGRDYFSPEGTIAMDLSSPNRNRVLQAGALYRADGVPVPIDAEKVHFVVLSPPGKPTPISMVAGVITAQHYGHALILSEYDGLTDLTCVKVVGRVEPGGDRTVCKELVPPGMSPPPSGLGMGALAKPMKWSGGP